MFLYLDPVEMSQQCFRSWTLGMPSHNQLHIRACDEAKFHPFQGQLELPTVVSCKGLARSGLARSDPIYI
jgi:hypothetical protein